MSRSEEAVLQIVGAGLLGTSVGLALAGRPWQVWIHDTDPRAERVAADLGAGKAGWCEGAPELILLAVPPSAVALVMDECIRLYPSATVSDVSSIKYDPQLEAQRLGVSERFVGGHPMAGRERSGATAARADLFEARPWAVCAPDGVPDHRVALVERLVRDCGADPVRMSAQEHDQAVGLVSHVPQVVASALAGELRQASAEAMVLAGQGLRDTVRIAASDATMWSDILAANAAVVGPLLRSLGREIADVGAALTDHAADKSTRREVDEAIKRLIAAGQEGYARIPGKHGTPATDYAVVPVVIPDEPGALAALFVAVADAGASVEDIRLEHSAGHPVGLVELSVSPDQAAPLTEALRAAGWSAH
jgi:prephenate dehydrogenase